MKCFQYVVRTVLAKSVPSLFSVFAKKPSLEIYSFTYLLVKCYSFYPVIETGIILCPILKFMLYKPGQTESFVHAK